MIVRAAAGVNPTTGKAAGCSSDLGQFALGDAISGPSPVPSPGGRRGVRLGRGDDRSGVFCGGGALRAPPPQNTP